MFDILELRDYRDAKRAVKAVQPGDEPDGWAVDMVFEVQRLRMRRGN